MKKPRITVIILNYNTKELLEDCLNSIKKHEKEVPLQVIVSDNASPDGSAEMVKKKFPWVLLLEGANEGFAKGNNRARPYVKGDMVLFLNPDTIVYKDVFAKTFKYLIDHKDVGAVTCKLLLLDGSLDKDVRRRYPTPLISFKRLVLGQGKEYWYDEIPQDVTHEAEAIQGAFMLTWKKILDKVGWFDENYVFDGEDIDLSFQIHKAGYKLMYYPEVYITHLKGAAKGKVKEWVFKVDKVNQARMTMAGVNSMEYFYKKNMASQYPFYINFLVIFGIKVFKLLRYIKLKIKK